MKRRALGEFNFLWQRYIADEKGWSVKKCVFVRYGQKNVFVRYLNFNSKFEVLNTFPAGFMSYKEFLRDKDVLIIEVRVPGVLLLIHRDYAGLILPFLVRAANVLMFS